MRATRAAAKNQSAPAKQNEEYAFNVFGWALKIPSDEIDVAHEAIIINAYEPAGPWDKAVTTMKKKGEDPWRESLALTPRESDPNAEAGVQRYLLIGFATRDFESQYGKKHPLQFKQKPAGIDVNDDGIVKCKDLPLMVVTQVQETEQPKVDLFVLLRPKRGLCTPHHIGQQNCFYLPKFRDGSTVLKERGPAWNALVAKQALRPSDRVLSKKQMAYKKARNTSKVVLEPAVSLQNSICTHVECFAESSDMWHLQEISSILEQADQDLLFMPIASNTAMRKFVDNEEEFEDGDSTTEGGDAALMLEEVRALWPDLKEIDAADLAFLKRQLMTQDVTLEYRLLRPFLFEACYRLRAFDNLSDVSTNVVADVLGSVQRIVGTCESAAPIITADDQALLLPAITMTLKNMLQAAQKFDKGLLDSCGDQTMTGTLQDVWEKYANALDTDAAKLSWMEAARYMVAAFKYKQRGLSDMLAEVVETLEKTGFGSSRSSESS